MKLNCFFTSYMRCLNALRCLASLCCIVMLASVAAHATAPSQDALLTGIRENLKYVKRKSASATAFSTPTHTITWKDLRITLEDLLTTLPTLPAGADLPSSQFMLVEVTSNCLVTGYYEPLVEVSATRTQTFAYPLYRLPKEISGNRQGRRFFSRRQIDLEHALAGKGLEIAYARDPVDVFFLQVQGSGRLRFRDGHTQRLRYAGHNGWGYTSIIPAMERYGYPQDIKTTMQTMRRFLAAHPDDVPEILTANPRYIFFQQTYGGPYGAMGVPLSPMLDVAVDPKNIALGSVLIVQGSLPDPAGGADIPFTSMALAQDTGAAIQGDRLDLFCGHGSNAATLAGLLQHPAQIYLLLSRRAPAAQSSQ
ncbi:MltA domain-containing protein [Desulfovibrio inopinatus]|uniref:MltA domain-containing protein n=1 Tax=Desulfovibrio inopinatus TaxID=102109 RepID=UPI0003F7E3E3|nr:MltA domain-containing protein [Desulfovibrio inopinatus]